ncbi:MAG: hypothetical protein LBL92_01045, partial [Propionibacteriaceae bacterium]|nr:hypothetical protein [Propionibacteriaceae bacterium]
MVVTTGLGSWPGTDPTTAIDQVMTVFPNSPFLPELPARGLGADMVGRTLGLITDLGYEPTATGWTATSHPSQAQRAAAARLRDDCDQVAEYLEPYQGPFHVSLTGPWTLAAVVGWGSGEVLLADRGARRDLGQAWVEAVRQWLERLRRLLPQVELTLQVDEPLLPQVTHGDIATVSGLHRHRPVEPLEIVAAYAGLPVTDLANVVLHCCAPGLDWSLPAAAGFTTVSLDVTQITTAERDHVAAFYDAGHQLWLGVVPTDRWDQPLPSFNQIVRPTRQLFEDASIDPQAGRV